MQSLKDVISGGVPPSKYLSGDKTSIDAFIDKFDVFLFDCDGRIPAIPQLGHQKRSLTMTSAKDRRPLVR